MRSKASHTRRRDRQRRLRTINALSDNRQRAWLETGKPFATARLTSEITANYEALRGERATDAPPDSWDDVHRDRERVGVEWLPYYGRPSRLADA